MATALDYAKQIMLPAYRIPSITAYNRLEATPRSTDLDQALAADVRDALWMLTRQWQFGEFQGEDAGSPVTAMILGEHTPVDRISLGGSAAAPYDPSMPLETAVEYEPLKPSLFLAVQIARYFLKLLRTRSLDTVYMIRLNAEYPLGYAIDPNDTDGLQLNIAVQTRLFDGCALLADIDTVQGTSTKFGVWLQAQSIPSADQATLNALAGNLSDWYIRNYAQPPAALANKAWQPSRLEYEFDLGSVTAAVPPGSVAAPGQKVLTADHFVGGHLDWYSFDVNTAGVLPIQPPPVAPNPVVENLVSFIPAPVAFKGMPNPRFWMMDDNQTDFGQIDTTPTGLLHLLVAEFGLIYGNDWFMLPYPLGINNICEIKGLVVTDVFGEHILIEPAGAGTANNWQKWAMFHQTDLNPAAAPNHLFYLAPAVRESLINDPLEVVNFLRDEVAAMVWAVENRVPSQAGHGVSGNLIALNNNPPPPFVPAGTAAIQYVLGTTVPSNWIPFIPVHIQGSDLEIQFQRAAMAGAKGALGQIIAETPAPYYINEEEIPGSGVIVQRSFNRARWLNGKTYLWMGRVKETGTGEGWSNLKFDQIVAIPAPPGR